MNDTIIFLLGLILGYVLGSKIMALWMRISFRELMKDLDIKPEQLKAVMLRHGIDPNVIEEEPAEPAKTLEIRIEKHQGVLFAYRCDTEEFLGQGNDQEALITSIKNRIRDVRLVISEQNGAELLQKG